MGKKLTVLFLTLAALLTVSGCAKSGETLPPGEDPGVETTELDAPAAPAEPDEPEPEPAPELSERDQGWVDDINYLREQYKTKHVDPFYMRSEEEFDWKLDQLIAEVGELSDYDIYFELSAIIAGMGDSHTRLTSSSDSGLIADLFAEGFPISLTQLGGKYYLYAYLADYEQFAPYLWHEVIAVNGVDIAYIQQRFGDFYSPYSPRCGDRMLTPYFCPALLDWAGCDYKEGYTLQILNDNREVESVELPVLTYEEFDGKELVEPERAKTFAGGNWAEYIQEDAGDCIYVAFDDMSVHWNLGSDTEYYLNFAKETNALIAAHPDCRKLVIDLRSNSGGWFVANTFMHLLEVPADKQTYVLVGPGTQSAAMSCIAIAREELNAVMVGMPTGQFTEFLSYAAYQSFDLPFSGIKVWFSSKWTYGPPITEVQYDEDGKLYEWENTILPDVYVEHTLEDLQEGRDGVMEWVLAQ